MAVNSLRSICGYVCMVSTQCGCVLAILASTWQSIEHSVSLSIWYPPDTRIEILCGMAAAGNEGTLVCVRDLGSATSEKLCPLADCQQRHQWKRTAMGHGKV